MKIFKRKKTGKLYAVGVSKAPYLGPHYNAEPYMWFGDKVEIKLKEHIERDFETVGERS